VDEVDIEAVDDAVEDAVNEVDEVDIETVKETRQWTMR
jgi:hypothetical protein